MCHLAKKCEGVACFFFRDGGSISKGGHVSSFEGGHWHGGSIGMGWGMCPRLNETRKFILGPMSYVAALHLLPNAPPPPSGWNCL